MLSREERMEIEEELKGREFKRAASIDALKVVQRRRGWVDDQGLKDVAAMLEMTPSELDSVATFYNLIFRRPVGSHVILVCNTISCWMMGCDNLLKRLTERLGVPLGATSSDGEFTLLPVPCLGACDQSPVMMVDGKLYGCLTPEKIDEILKEHGWKG